MKTRYVTLTFLVLLSIITYMDRICIGVLAGPMQKDLGISEEGWGWIIAAFLLGYGLFEIPTGGLGDWLGQRKVLARIVVWWSAFTVLTGLARNYYLLFATRFLFGAGEAGAYPNASGVIDRWFPAAERARAQGIVWGASRVGGALTPLVLGPLLGSFTWQIPFYVFGVVGLLWAAAWLAWFREDARKHPAMTPEELAEIGPPRQHLSHRAAPWGPLFRSPQLWLIMAMYWFYVFGAIFFMFSLTKYFTDGRGLSQYEAHLCVSLAFGSGAIGNAIGGWVSDGLSKRYGLWIGRCVVGAVCLAVTGCLQIATAFSPGKFAAAAWLIVAFGVMDGMLPAAWAVCLDVGRRHAGAVSGAMNTAGQAAAAVCMALSGYWVVWYGHERPLFLFAINMFVGAVLFLMIDPTRPLVPESPVAAPDEEPVCV